MDEAGEAKGGINSSSEMDNLPQMWTRQKRGLLVSDYCAIKRDSIEMSEETVVECRVSYDESPLVHMRSLEEKGVTKGCSKMSLIATTPTKMHI
ncbi:hypothetical protein JTE90_020321 [Oedothorax gibbosus]|uniref:Uncharacterized protein n=1 Tax=Oedothorax gibbosus TaxID=931172 RepID=A0AAV6VPB4_9ARAC|nr:hypothetical protein JTE90_020321 [Oedothorax gibbosus]